MKKSILTLALFFSIGIPALFASDDHGISRKMAASFNKDFSGAKQVQWTKEKNGCDARFILDGQVMTAYYNGQAELIAVVHHILTDRLPIFLLTSLKSDYHDYWVSGLFESASDHESSYHITLENADQIIEMRSVNATEWVTERRIEKYDL
jgi:hypothetical protein